MESQKIIIMQDSDLEQFKKLKSELEQDDTTTSFYSETFDMLPLNEKRKITILSNIWSSFWSTTFYRSNHTRLIAKLQHLRSI